MVIMGLYNMGDVPFTDVFIHANILDGKGERMSKSKGNGIDPVDIIERYGADAMRYVLCDMQTGMQDIRLPVQAISPYTGDLIDLATARHGQSIFTYLCPATGKEFDVLGTMPDVPAAKLVSERFEAGRNFCNKLLNAVRFALMNLADAAFQPLQPETLPLRTAGSCRGFPARVEAVHGHWRPITRRRRCGRRGISSGTSCATGTSNSSSRACATPLRPGPRSRSWRWPSTRCCASFTPSCPT